MRRIDESVAQEIAAQYARGIAIAQISATLKVSSQTIYNILRRQGHNPQRIRRINRKTQNQVVRLCIHGSSIANAAQRSGISEKSADRILRTKRQEKNILVRRGRPNDIERLARFSSDIVTNEIVNDIYRKLRRFDFPFPSQLSSVQVEHELRQLYAFSTRIQDDVIEPRSNIGLAICRPLFPNRFKATRKNHQSAFAAWHDEIALKKAIAFQIQHGDPVTPARVLRALMLQCRTPTIFRPTVAKFVYETFCPRNGTVWDPCSGFGGRLLGAFAAKVRYIGTDVDGDTIEGNRHLAEIIGSEAALHHERAENFTPPRVDLVFTSPPYFNRERYSRDENQSWRRYRRSFEQWSEGFLIPVIHRARGALRDGGFLILNVADLRDGGKRIPLVDETRRMCCTSGFVHTATLQMPLAAINRKAPTEPVLVFRKA